MNITANRRCPTDGDGLVRNGERARVRPWRNHDSVAVDTSVDGRLNRWVLTRDLAICCVRQRGERQRCEHCADKKLVHGQAPQPFSTVARS